MTIKVQLQGVKRNEESREKQFVPSGNRLADQLGAAAARHEYEPKLMVSLQVTSDEGANFVFTHEVYPATSLDDAAIKAQSALMQFAADLQGVLRRPI